ncbi:MAG: hypothetical protein M1838_001221 [Thelocarpon superellum]|nr:MAG: hypothetical protein M1838_001221 [Thelocarpon superellum]
MKVSPFLLCLFVASDLATSLVIPGTTTSLALRDVTARLLGRAPESHAIRSDESLTSDLEKRRGGGGGGGGGGKGGGGGSSSSSGSSGESSGSSSSGSSGSSSSGSSGSSSSSGSSGGASAGSFSSSSNAGGSTVRGSGVAPSYGGGGRYYGGGSASPYTSGRRSPLGITPFLLPLAALAIFSGPWLYPAYAYPYSHPYYFQDRNHTNSTNPNGTTVALPVECLCQEYSVCGCDDNNGTFLETILPNGSDTSNLNRSLIQINMVNGTKTIVLNGTLPNGTTAPGGTDPSSGATKQVVLQHSIWMVLGAVVYGMVWML